MLEDQLESSRKRCGQIMSIENELYKYKAELHNCQLECENDKKRIEELEAENLQLQMSSKSSISESQSILGMISHKMSLITIFGLKHKIKNFIQKFDIFHKKISTAFDFGLYLEKNCKF